MSLVPCEKCQKPISVTAETCPHCAHTLPEGLFQAGIKYDICPYCQARNFPFQKSCRSCQSSLLLDHAKRRGRWHFIRAGFAGQAFASLGALVAVVWCLMAGILEGIDDVLVILSLLLICLICGALVGWLASIGLGMLSRLASRYRS